MIKNTPVIWYSCRSHNQMSYIHKDNYEETTENWDTSKIGLTKIITSKISSIGHYYYNDIGEDSYVTSSIGDWSHSYNYVSQIGL